MHTHIHTYTNEWHSYKCRLIQVCCILATRISVSLYSVLGTESEMVDSGVQLSFEQKV